MSEPQFQLDMAKAMLANIVDDSDWTPDRARDLHVELTMAIAEVERLRKELETEQSVKAALDSYELEIIRQKTAEVEQFRARVAELEALINTPRVDDFLSAVRTEAAHQVERWGVEHDAGKRPEDWIALVVYLLGKATKAHCDGDREKLLHHVVALGAVAMNWHANATGADTRMRPGVAPAASEVERLRSAVVEACVLAAAERLTNQQIDRLRELRSLAGGG